MCTFENKIVRGNKSHMGIGNDNDYKVSCSVQKRSSFRAPTLWFIDLAVATCHIQYTFCVYAIFFLRENGQNIKIYLYHTKMATDSD